MAVTFGTRSAMRDLAEELGPAEQVVELAACTYAGAGGLVALTTERVIAIRDDYSKHQVQFVVVAEVGTVDYDPTVHDGFALFTATGRLVVRKMRREDGDRLVDALLTRAPHIVIQVTRPVGAAAAAPTPQLGRLGRHRKPASGPEGARPAQGGGRLGPAVSAQAGAAHGAAQAAGHLAPAPAAAAPAHADAMAQPAGMAAPGGLPTPPGGGLPTPPGAVTGPAPAGPPVHRAPTPAASGGAPAPAPTAYSPAPAPAPVAEGPAADAGGSGGLAGGVRPATDKEILLGVLADLHAQGVLTADEFAAKVRQIVSQR